VATSLRARALLATLLLLSAAGLAGCDLLFPDADLSAWRLPVGHLVSTRGPVKVEHDGRAGTAELGYLFLKDALETGPEGAAKVRFGNGRLVEVGPDARFVIGEDKTGLVLEVARGLVLSRVPAGADGTRSPDPGSVALSILTPFGITRVGSSQSELSVEVGRDDAKVNVLLGSVEFISRNGQSTSAAAGETLSLTAEKVEILGRKGQASEAPKQIELAEIQVTITASGKADLKKKDSKKWAALGRKAEKLGTGDSVRVRDGRGTIDLGGAGSRLALEKDSEVVFGESGRAGDVEQTKLDMKKGAVTLTLAPNQKSRVELPGLQLESDLGGQFGVQLTKDGFIVSAVAGDLRISRNGVQQAVQAGQVATLGSGGAAKVDTEDQAALELPSKQGMKVYHAGLPGGSLTWPGPSGTYYVEVALDAAFTERIIAGQVHGKFLNVSLPRKGNLYWRVFKDDGKTQVDQGSAYFAPEPPIRDLARLRNDVPEGSETVSIYYQDKPPAVTFTYKPEEKATQYKVVVFRADALDTPVVDRTVPEERLALEAGTLTEGSYVWSVTPLSETGEELRGGRMNKLEMVYDNSVPVLAVTEPRNGAEARGGQTHVAGVAPVGTRLTVNGRPVELDDKNRFDATVAVGGRPPQVVFRLSKPGASDSFTIRALKRAR